MKHYAGNVTYKVDGFVEKNKDTLFTDLIISMKMSTCHLISHIFKDDDTENKKRPLTAGTQFKNALNALVDRLLAGNPHYVRCIKPNEEKRALSVNEERTRHQIRYLGLLENVRVRRAGFAFRQPYDRFLHRYKMVCPETWPFWKSNDRDGCVKVLQSMNLGNADYKTGKTKVFLKDPKTLFALEERREKELPKIVTKMQNVVRGFLARKKYGKTRAAMRIVAFFRWARSKYYLKQVLTTFKGVENTPDVGMKTIQWPPAPPILQKGLEMMKELQATWWAHEKLRTVAPGDMAALKQKVRAYELFHGNKVWIPARCWESTYLERDTNPNRIAYSKSMEKLFAKYHDQKVMFCDYMDKRNSKNKMQRRGIVVTEANIYKQDPKKHTIAQEPIPVAAISKVILSKGKDQLIIIQTGGGAHPDLLLDLTCGTEEDGKERISEFVTVLDETYSSINNANKLDIQFGDGSEWRGKPKAKPLQISFTELEADLEKKRKPSAKGAVSPRPGASPASPRKDE